jgi:hypothetical protein
VLHSDAVAQPTGYRRLAHWIELGDARLKGALLLAD